MPEQQELWGPVAPVPTDTDGRPLPDVCDRKHGGNEQSREAFERVAPTIPAVKADILAWLGRVGRGTPKQYAALVGKPLHAVSGRFSDLRRDLKIIETADLPLDGSAFVRLA